MTSAASISAPQGRVLAVVNKPAPNIDSTQALVTSVFRQLSDIEATQAVVLAVVRGRISYPHVRAWTFTLDGHDYYVLRLGAIETLVYDTYAQEWYVWGSDAADLWRAYNGCNWQGANAFAGGYGSNIVVGDDTLGVLYFLDPDADADDDPAGSGNQVVFERIVEGQVALKGYAQVPCFGVELLGSIGDNAADGSTSIELEYSDDRGDNYVSAGTIDVASGSSADRVNWPSLGSMKAPGRLFRVTDYGALKRIDCLDMADGR